jgi:hypothetical protein
LEEYVYDMRSKLDGKYAQYAAAAEKEKLLGMLSDAEEWLYTEEGEDALKSAYVSRLDALLAIGGPIAKRYAEAENRPKFVSALRDTINLYIIRQLRTTSGGITLTPKTKRVLSRRRHLSRSGLMIMSHGRQNVLSTLTLY